MHLDKWTKKRKRLPMWGAPTGMEGFSVDCASDSCAWAFSSVSVGPTLNTYCLGVTMWVYVWMQRRCSCGRVVWVRGNVPTARHPWVRGAAAAMCKKGVSCALGHVPACRVCGPSRRRLQNESRDTMTLVHALACLGSGVAMTVFVL